MPGKELRVLILDKEDWLRPENGPGRDDEMVSLTPGNGDSDGGLQMRTVNGKMYFRGRGMGRGMGKGNGFGYGLDLYGRRRL